MIKIGDKVKALVGRNAGKWGTVSALSGATALVEFSGAFYAEGEYYEDYYWVHLVHLEEDAGA